MRQAADVDMISTPTPVRISGAVNAGGRKTWRAPVPTMTTSGSHARSRAIVAASRSPGPRSLKSVAGAPSPSRTVSVNVVSSTLTNPAPYAVIRWPPASEWSFMPVPLHGRCGMVPPPVRGDDGLEERRRARPDGRSIALVSPYLRGGARIASRMRLRKRPALRHALHSPMPAFLDVVAPSVEGSRPRA